MFEKKQKFIFPLDTSTKETNELFFSQSGSDELEVLEGEEGQLSVDIGQNRQNLIIVATMSGTKPENIELHLRNDLLTIRGYREPPVSGINEYLINENYWGAFSRTIVLPVDVKSEFAQAEYKQGVLTIILPKQKEEKDIPIFVVEE